MKLVTIDKRLSTSSAEQWSEDDEDENLMTIRSEFVDGLEDEQRAETTSLDTWSNLRQYLSDIESDSSFADILAGTLVPLHYDPHLTRVKLEADSVL